MLLDNALPIESSSSAVLWANSVFKEKMNKPKMASKIRLMFTETSM